MHGFLCLFAMKLVIFWIVGAPSEWLPEWSPVNCWQTYSISPEKEDEAEVEEEEEKEETSLLFYITEIFSYASYYSIT